MKWWIYLLINIVVFIGSAVLADLWLHERPYDHNLVPNWIIKGAFIGSLFTLVLWWPRKKRSA